MKVRQNGTAWEVISEAGLVVSTHESEEAATAALASLQEASEPPAVTGTLELAGQFLRLAEGASGLVWEVCLIREGWSANNRFYSAAVLEAAIPFFEGLTAGYYRDEGHTSFEPDQLAGNVAGWFESVRGAVGDDGKYALWGRFQCVDAELGAKMAQAFHRNKTDLLGFSIHALGETRPGLAEGRSGDIVTKIHGVGETTVVRRPAAGGRVVRLVAAINHQPVEEIIMKKWLKARLLSKSRDASGVDALEGKALCEAVAAQLREGPTDQVVLALAMKWVDTDAEKAKELLQTLIDGGAAATDAAEAPPPAPGMYEAIASQAQTAAAAATSAVDQAKALLHEAKVEGCKTVLNQVLAEAKLSEDVEKLVRKQFTGVFDRNALVEAVAEYQKAFAPVGATNGGPDQGQPRVQVIAEARDKMAMAMELRMGYKPEKDTSRTPEEVQAYKSIGRSLPSIREAYIAMTGDTKVTGRYGPGALCEATTADFPNTLGTAMNRLTRQFMVETPTLLDPLFVENPNMENMKTQEVDLWGGWGDMPVVTEGSAYQSGGFPREEKSTYDPKKRGLTVELTWEMFLNDNLRLLQDIPRKLARATSHTHELMRGKALIGNLAGAGINTDDLWDSTDIYHANHRNKTTSALSYTALIAARQQLEQQYERGNSTLMNDSGGISDSDTSVTVVSTEGMFPGQYIQIKAEIIKIAAITSATVLDITGGRGALGTAADTHVDGLRVYQLVRPIPIVKFFVVVPTELRGTLFEILNSEKVPDLSTNTKNFLAAEYEAGGIVPIVVPTMYMGGDTNNWFCVADPTQVPCLEQGFLFGQREGELFYQNGDTNGAVFTHDKLTYKKRVVSGFKQIDFTGLQGNIVA